MKKLRIFSLIVIILIGLGFSSCEFEELSASKSEPRCTVNYSVVYINTSKTDMYMGENFTPISSDIVKAGSSRTESDAVILLMTTGHEEELYLEMHIRSLDNLYYNYKSFTVLPKDWDMKTDSKDLKRANLNIQINCTYDGSNVTVKGIQK